MKIKSRSFLIGGVFGFATGIGLCWQITGRLPFLSAADPHSDSTITQSSGGGGVCASLLDISGESFERGRSGEGSAIFVTAISSPSTTMRELGLAVESLTVRANSVETPLRVRLELLRVVGTKLIERAGSTENPEDLAGLFGMRDRITEIHADLVNKTAAALLVRIKALTEAPPAPESLLRTLASFGEWRDFTVASRFAPAGWEPPEEIGECVSILFDRTAVAIPSREEFENMLLESVSSHEGGGKGTIEAVKTGLSARVREVTGDDVISIPEALGDPALNERYGILSDSLVAALRECEAYQLKTYNLWALTRIQAAETSPEWESALAAVDTAFLQSVVASLYSDVSVRKLNVEQDPGQRAAKVRVMVRQKKLKPTDF